MVVETQKQFFGQYKRMKMKKKMERKQMKMQSEHNCIIILTLLVINWKEIN